MSTIFTKIINNEIPAKILYQDDMCIVILDRSPIAKGHVLVISKLEVDKIYDLPIDVYTHIWSVAKSFSSKIQATFNPSRIGILVDGYGVPHAHIHLIPTFGPNELDDRFAKVASEEELESVYQILKI